MYLIAGKGIDSRRGVGSRACRTPSPHPARSSTRARRPSRGVAATVILLRGGADRPRGAAGPAQPRGTLHGRGVGVPGRSGQRRGRRGRGRATRRRPYASCSEEAGIVLDDPDELVAFSRWITPAEVKIRYDTWFFLATMPAGQEPRDRRCRGRRRALVLAPGGARRLARATRSCSCSPRSSTWSSCPAFARSTSCSTHARAQTVRPVQPRVLGSRRDGADRAPGRARLRRVSLRGRRHRLARDGAAPSSRPRARGLTVAVTGPTGDIGRSLLRALERSRRGRPRDGDGTAAVRSGRRGSAQDRVPPGRRARS